eukprot:362508-Chlamydomonas_euryale.AAC.1
MSPLANIDAALGGSRHASHHDGPPYGRSDGTRKPGSAAHAYASCAAVPATRAVLNIAASAYENATSAADSSRKKPASRGREALGKG